MHPRLIRVLRTVLFFGLVGGVVFFSPIQEIIDAIRRVSPIHFWMSVLLGLPLGYMGAVQLWMLTRMQGIQISPLKLFEINLVVKFYSFFSPASAVGSLLRWYKISADGKSAEALTAVAVNRLFDVFISILMGLFWILVEANESILVKPIWIMFFLMAVILIWIFLTRYSHPILSWIEGWSENSRSRWIRKVGSYLGRLSASLYVYSRLKAHHLIFMIVLGIAGELLGVLSYYYLALSINIPVSFISLGWMRSIFFLTSLMPLTLVGGIGLREVSVVWALTTVGVHTDVAAAYSFLVYVRSVVISAFGGLIELFSLPKLL